jgi:hypothetical protein
MLTQPLPARGHRSGACLDSCPAHLTDWSQIDGVAVGLSPDYSDEEARRVYDGNGFSQDFLLRRESIGHPSVPQRTLMTQSRSMEHQAAAIDESPTQV